MTGGVAETGTAFTHVDLNVTIFAGPALVTDAFVLILVDHLAGAVLTACVDTHVTVAAAGSYSSGFTIALKSRKIQSSTDSLVETGCRVTKIYHASAVCTSVSKHTLTLDGTYPRVDASRPIFALRSAIVSVRFAPNPGVAHVTLAHIRRFRRIFSAYTVATWITGAFVEIAVTINPVVAWLAVAAVRILRINAVAV